MQIQLLDCTLRDGGYVNNWNFGNDTLICIFERLVKANVDLIEIGFLDARQQFNPNRTIQPTNDCYNKIFVDVDKGASKVFAMIDYGTCPLENITPRADGFIDGIRVIFKKPNMRNAVAFGRLLQEKGYLVSFQLVSITDYSDRDILDLCDLVNHVAPYAVSIVDTYGLMHKAEMLNYFHLLNHNLNRNIAIGYHSHNNFQLAYANTIDMVSKASNRNVVADGSVYGMGKSAGNAPLELLAMHLNEQYQGQYDISQILEIIDGNIMRIYEQHYWGYSMLYFLAASNACHPNYINYLLKKKTLSTKAINTIAGKIEPEHRLVFNKDYAEKLYFEYQHGVSKISNDSATVAKLLNGNKLLILGPGKSIAIECSKINEYIEKEKPLIISVNCVPENYQPNLVFFSNAKRYQMLYRRLKKSQSDCKVIATSNITHISRPFDYVVDYERFLDENSVIKDNSLAMFFNILQGTKPASIVLAGFDGFSANTADNFYEEYMELPNDYEYLLAINQAIVDKIERLRNVLDINFLTTSVYLPE